MVDKKGYPCQIYSFKKKLSDLRVGLYLGSSKKLSLNPATKFTAPNIIEMRNSRHKAAVIFGSNNCYTCTCLSISEYHIKNPLRVKYM
jgi:hypothetical protein